MKMILCATCKRLFWLHGGHKRCLPCSYERRLETNNASKKKNFENWKAANKRWHEKHPEKNREYCAKYRAECREVINFKQRNRTQEERDRINARRRELYALDPEKINAKQRERYALNRDKILARQRERRAEKKAARLAQLKEARAKLE